MYKTLSLSHWKKIFASFLTLLPQLFLFELVFKFFQYSSLFPPEKS